MTFGVWVSAAAQQRPSWPAGLALAAILALGGWLRLDQVVDQTLIDDEWHALHQLLFSSPGRFLLSRGHDDHSIPLTAWYWLLANSVGLSELGMRLPSLLAGGASLVLLPWALRGALPLRVLLVFALLLAVSTLLIGYSRMARPYALMLLISVSALGLLARALAGGRPNWPVAATAALLAGLAAWLHAVCAPFLLGPLLVLLVAHARGEGLRRRDLALVAALWVGALVIAVLPPLVNDLASLTGKSGLDWPRLSTWRGVWYVWLGSGSTLVVLLSLALAAVGVGAVWRSGPVPRWTFIGLALTLSAVLLLRPAWVFNPLTLARYLLPALPLLLLCVAAGLVRVVERALSNAALPLRRAALAASAIALALGTAWASPQPALLARPNSNTLHYLYQFDFRARHNPVVAAFDGVRVSPFWASLSAQPRSSATVALAPFRFESPAWLAPLWERASRQRVLPGMLSGPCASDLRGEVPLDPRFRLRNAVHLADDSSLKARAVTHVAFDRRGTVLDSAGRWRAAPACEAWMRQRFGTPVFEDSDLVVWPLR